MNYISLLLLLSLVRAVVGDGIKTNSLLLPPATGSARPRAAVVDEKHVLGAGDRISYRVQEDGDEAVSLLITDSGEVEIPYLWRVAAAGKTCAQLRKEIKLLLELDLYKRATVVIGIELLSKFRGKIYLVGKVKNPGPIDLPNDETLTVSKAILKAGGFAEFANQRKVKLIRNSSQDVKSDGQLIDVAAIWEKGSMSHDIELEAGDLIYVPSKLVNF
jgi:polysaccharide export outer membrane protein